MTPTDCTDLTLRTHFQNTPPKATLSLAIALSIILSSGVILGCFAVTGYLPQAITFIGFGSISLALVASFVAFLLLRHQKQTSIKSESIKVHSTQTPCAFDDLKHQKHIENLIAKHHLLWRDGKKAIISSKKSWFFLPKMHSRNKETHEKINADWKYLPDFLSDLSNNSCVIQESVIKNLAHEYKLHIMPQPKHFFTVLEHLLKAIDEDKALQESLYRIKVYREFHTNTISYGGYVPKIVIYARYGKECAQIALNRITEALRDDFSMGSGLIPRYNFAGNNPLIFYAHGDSSKKHKLKQQSDNDFQKLFDKDGIHYNQLFGDFKLQLPEGF